MRKRSLSIIFVVVAFLFGAWSNVIAAAFCPRYMLKRDCAIKHEARQPRKVEHRSSCRHEMAGMEVPPKSRVDSIPENSPLQLTTEYAGDPVAFDVPIGPCPHCWMHSQPASGTATIVAGDPSRRLLKTNASPANFAVALPFTFPFPITPLEHGPPGSLFPRYVLINAFRI